MKKVLFSFGLLGLLLLSVRSFAQTTYTKITSSSGLEVGAHYIIVGHHDATGVLAMGYQKPNNRKAVMVSENGDAITVTPGTDPDSETDVFQFTLGGSAGAWTFFDEVKGGYLYAPSSTSNYLRTQAILDANGQWSIVFNTDGTAEVVALGENTRNNMRFNPDNYPDGDPRFSCYTETSIVDTRVSFYKAGGTVVPDHAYVDLGLPSGTLWAICNVGADTPEGYGDHFAWGETQPKDNYGWNNYQYCNGSGSSLIKYCSNSSYGYLDFTDTLTILLPEDDAATANWGNGWRMPTEEEWQELYQNTSYTLTTQNGVNGWLFTASNGNSLFLPFPGYRSSSSIYFAGDYGYYWSSSLCTSQPNYAWYFYCGSDSYSYYGLYSNYGRGRGLSVRAVRSGSPVLSYTINVLASPDEGGTVTGGGTYNQGATCTLTATAYEDYNFVNWTENGEVVSVNPVYSFVVTSNRNLVANFNQTTPDNYVITATANPTEGGTVNMGGMANLLYDTFEEYAIGNKIASAAIANGHDWWTTWDNLPGSNEDGVVAYYDGTQCGHFTYGNDQILLLGNAVSGLYDLQFDVLVPNGKNGYFNVMHHFAGSQSSWAMECYLHMTNDGFNSTSAPGHGTVNAGSIGTCDLPCVYDEWMHFHIHIDIDNDVAQLYFNVVGQPEVMYAEWQWSLNLYGTDVIDGTIEAVNFYPPMTSQTSEFYLDNVRFSQFNERCLTANNDGHTFAEMNSKRDAVRTYDYYEYGDICTLIAMANEGYSFVNWTKNGTVVSTNNSYSFTVTEDATFVANFTPNQGEITQVSNFSQGYNWWGTYIELDGIDGLGTLEEGLVDNGVSIRSQASGYTDYYEDYGWYGSLSGINNESSYRVITSAPCTVSMTGSAAVPSEHPITLSQGWTWIGYVPSTAMSVDAAMAGVDATSGDKLKSQQGYSDYYEGYGWFGSLNTIEPGMGLMYYSTNSSPVTLTYPDSNRGGEVRANLISDNNHWVPNVHAYPDNMTVMAVVELDDVEINTEHYELAAFAANGECRGSVKLIFAEPLHRHVAFLTISGKDASELSFRLYDTETGKEYYDAEESLDFVANAIVGDARDLYVVHFRGTTGMDEFASNVKVYPNPVNRGERFSIGMNAKSKSLVHVEIINALGTVVSMETLTQTPASIVAPITAGVYTLRISCEEDTCYRKIIVR